MTFLTPLLRRMPISRILFSAMFVFGIFGPTLSQEIPEPLKDWEDWATWGVEHRDCPTIYSSADQPICYWPSRLELSADADGGRWSMAVNVFEEAWIPLAGTSKIWPVNVRAGDDPVVVVQHDGTPAVKLPAGMQKLSGAFQWEEMPQRIAVPNQVGIVSLQVDGEEVAIPTWDSEGNVWLKRTRDETADKDLLSLQVYRVIEDGIPLWLRTEIELTVSGKSREETLGWILPEGWQLATVESEVPVAIDDRGLTKAQVRAGKWTVVVHAFRTNDAVEVKFAVEAQPVTNSELIGLQTDPQFRISQIEDLAMIDVTQTTFPAEYRGLPVYQWDTSKTFRLVEKMRGMGEQSPEGLTIHRRLWLDEDGKGITYQDKLHGTMQQIWRLDVAQGHELGAVRVDDQGQLITANPKTGASGVEIRKRELSMEAIGRVDRTAELAASGWQTDVDSLQLTMTMPPGWRAFAVFGADQVEGDWLTAWSLLDLFLLLIFSLAVFRLFGFVPGMIALVAFGLAYHEPGSPRLTWLFLLMPIALLRVVGEGAGKRLVLAWKYFAITLLLFCLIPFIAMQSQSVIYPQLESTNISYGSRSIFGWPGDAFRSYPQATIEEAYDQLSTRADAQKAQSLNRSRFDSSNLLYEPKSRIQTGPAQPQWSWNDVHCFWNGPVAAQQNIKPILISLFQHRVLTMVRLALLMLLAAILLRTGKLRFSFGKRKAMVAASLAMCLVPASAQAQLPDQEMLETLRARVLETPDAFPNAAEIPLVNLSIQEGRISMKTQVHAALDVAVPLPGRLPAWSPVAVTIDDEADVLVSRRDGYLWVLVPQGVHEITVEGLLPNQTDWEWTFELKPRYVVIEAPGWKVTGVNEDGVPDQQVFFVKEQARSDDKAAYDRTDFNSVVLVDRYVEMGLTAKVRTEVTRLSSPGKAISLEVPLLDGESVLTSGREVKDGSISVRLGATDGKFTWDSELPIGQEIELNAEQTDRWVERWHLITSPVWNVTLEGLKPIFEAEEQDLIPVWHPWPGESVSLAFNKPTAVIGDVITVQNVNHETTIGSRRRTSKLLLDLECSLASDFIVELDPEAEIDSLRMDNNSVPVQRQDAKLIIPARPGKQQVALEWSTSEVIDSGVRASKVVLPVDASNVTTVMQMPESRWILWANGPLRGPAVRFWTILLVAILAAVALGSTSLSPLRRYEWVLLAIGLTQVHLILAAIVVGWLFLLAWRGSGEITVRAWTFNLLQIGIVLFTFAALAILMIVVGEGLLGNPDMFIIGNGSWGTHLQWFQPRSGPELPTTYVLSVSVWFYRLLMLFWALWLATALLRWLTWGWNQFSHGGAWRRKEKPIMATEVQV